MNWTAKLRSTAATVMPQTSSKPGPATATAMAASPNVRVSNGLKEFLWLLSDATKPRILDLGNVSQSTLNFFIEKGFRVSTEDLLRSWKEFLTAEEEMMRGAAVGEDGGRVSQSSLAGKFLETSVQYAPESFNGVLAWDLFDYLDSNLLSALMERIFSLLSPGAAVLAMFHSRTPERFHRYRIVNTQSVEHLPAPTISVHTRIFQNREILDLFGKFRTSKTFVSRDQLREALFLK